MGPVPGGVRETVRPAASGAGDASAWKGPFVPDTVSVGVGVGLEPGPAARAPQAARTMASRSIARGFMLVRRGWREKVPRSGRFARRRYILDLGIEREGAWIDGSRGIEDGRDVGRAGDGLHHRPQPGGAAETPQAPGDELAEQPRAALGAVIVEDQVAVPRDQVDLLDPGEGGDGLASRESCHGLPNEPEVAEDAAAEHHGIDARLANAPHGIVGAPEVAAAGYRDLDRRLDLRDRDPVGRRVVTLRAGAAVNGDALDAGRLQPRRHL